MTKQFVFALAVVGGSFSSPADSFRLEGEAFQPSKNVEIVWNVATNDLPRNLWIYKVTPYIYSPAVLSNLMAIGGFKKDDFTKPANPPVSDTNVICFRDSKGDHWTRALTIAPTFGWIEYHDDGGNFSDPIEGVPTNDEVEKLAIDCLFQMGIDRELLCDKRTGYDATQGKLSPDGRRLTTNIVSRGITFARQVDGVNVRGLGFRIHFGRHAKIKNFSVSWRNLLPYEAHRVATPKEMVDQIRAGHAVQLPWEDLTGLDQAKKLDVVKITPRYFDKIGSEPLDFMYPYADLELVADMGTTNKTTFYLRCPILRTNSPMGL